MKKVTFQDTAIAYETVGKGPAVVLIHGFCEDSRVWEEFSLDLVEEKYKVIAIDLPGFGSSDVWPDVTIADMAGAVHAVLQDLKQDKVIMIGHSMGGYVGLAFAEKHPEMLIGLGMFHSQPYADSEEKKEGRQKGIGFIRRQGSALYVKQLIPALFAPDFVNSNAFLIEKLTFRASKYDAEGIIGGLQAMKNRPDRSQVLENIACPVLFIVGKKDNAIPAEKSMEQTHLPTISSIHILEKVGHMGMFEATKHTQLFVRKFIVFCLDQVN
ncbi:MAG: alpha/beta hydrolase [Saprospiraceae bacterium]|nr:alpha/beta hydrolase [Saprospiraceae bacterium]